MNYRGFQYKGQTHRIIGRTVREHIQGYVGTDEYRLNVLQKRVGWWARIVHPSGWADVETERVPGHVLIEIGTLGSSDWQSPMIHRIEGEVR